MMSKRQRTQTNRPAARDGFTLMEVLLVLAILVVLLTLVAPRIMGTQKKADAQNAAIQIGAFKTPLEQYALEMKTFPTTEQGLAALIEAPSDAEDTTQWGGPYLDHSAVPKDPWGHDYQYEYPATHGDNPEGRDVPDIWSLGPDGEDSTDDDIVNWQKETEEQQN
jgi:general secretion pathway protein G